MSPTNAPVDWNKHVIANPDGGNVFQSTEFAEQKKANGWSPRYIKVNEVAITILEKPVISLGKLWYIPKGPGITSVVGLDGMLAKLRTLAKEQGVFAIKIEPELQKANETLADLMKLGLVKTRPIQPNFSTILVDISPDLDTVLTNLNQKGRHAIRRAQRDGVAVSQIRSTDKNCRVFYDLLAKTAAGSFGIRNSHYYKTFWQRFEKAGMGQMFFAYAEGQVVAAAYALVFGKKSTYKDGASVRERSAYGASHLLQWEVIRWAKTKGSVLHDLCGAPPSDQINNPNHPHYGIGRFKTSFNKEVTDYIGTYDIIVNPMAYRMWTKIGERVTLRIYHFLQHESWY
jgi:lipid II:glycine glycyltransferase (peptidoglycan interpeptide bridge formation enzyme)